MTGNLKTTLKKIFYTKRKFLDKMNAHLTVSMIQRDMTHCRWLHHNDTNSTCVQEPYRISCLPLSGFTSTVWNPQDNINSPNRTLQFSTSPSTVKSLTDIIQFYRKITS
jgi:hypothetical protein